MKTTMTDRERAAFRKRFSAVYRKPPPTIGQFIDDPRYLGLGDQCCSVVREALEEIFAPKSQYREVALIWGIGTGKSFLTSIATAYIAYRVLCLRDPHEYYGLAPGTNIAISNFSITATQAKKVVFGEVAQRIDSSPAFKEDGFRRNERVKSELLWPDRGLSIFPGTSQASSAIGYNLLAGIVDEASFLPEVDGSSRGGSTGGHTYDASEELYNSIIKRILSRGNQRWQRDSLYMAISSPRYVDDYLERKAREAENNPRIYHSRIPTWRGTRASSLSGETFHDTVCGEVPVEFGDQFDRDPERARRDLGAQPSLAIGGFFSDPAKIMANANDDRQAPLDEYGNLTEYDHPDEVLYVHVDLGLMRDACGIAAAYADNRKKRINLVFSKRITPADHGGEIDFEEVREFIVNLRDMHGWRIGCVTFDGWQSVDSRQILRKAGISTSELSVDRNTTAYDTLKELIYTERLDYYLDEVLRRELCQLELVKGKKVDHPPHGSKDVADAVAGAVYGAYRASGGALAGEEDEHAFDKPEDDAGLGIDFTSTLRTSI